MLKGKTILIGVTGSIAAYKTASLCSMLKKQGAEIHVMLTKNGEKFIGPATFEALTRTPCLTDTFDSRSLTEIPHISLAEKADLVLIAPASANIIGKIAGGIADDMLTSCILACKCVKMIAPAMNTNMYTNEIVQDNLRKLQQFGYSVIDPAVGYLACGTIGAGKMPEPAFLYDCIVRELFPRKDLAGKKVLVTAGATIEPIDPVRYITNHSTGKMGCAVARAAMLRGAAVTLVAGKLETAVPPFINTVRVTSAKEMRDAVMDLAPEMDIIVKAAAVADYAPSNVASEKIKKKDGTLTLELERNPDILQELGARKKAGQILCGFAMETQNLIENARAKLLNKNLDIIAANSLRIDGAGFASDTNVLTLLTKNEMKTLPKMSKDDAAMQLLDKIIALA